MATERPLVIIVGPTASGKTGLAIRLAKKFDGEVISADSRTIYRGMTVGTAKPTAEEMDGVPHHLLDLIDPNERFTLWDFQRLAKEKVYEIRQRDKTPFLVGGSGLYVDSIIFDYEITSQVLDTSMRQKLQEMTIDNLIMMIKEQRLELPNNYKNKRHLIRVLEQGQVNRERLTQPIDNTIIVGITTEKEILEARIRSRSQQMVKSGLIDETKSLVAKFGDQEAFRNNSYGEVQKFLCGEITDREELINRIVIVDRQLAKKQLTWFKRNRYIKWLALDQAYGYVANILRQF